MWLDSRRVPLNPTCYPGLSGFNSVVPIRVGFLKHTLFRGVGHFSYPQNIDLDKKRKFSVNRTNANIYVRGTMLTHSELRTLQARSLKMQGWIRQQTFSPEKVKTLRRFSSWEVSELIFGMNQSTFRGKLAADPTLPAGKVELDGRQRWFTLEEVNTLRRKLKPRGKPLMPARPQGRAFRTAIANFRAALESPQWPCTSLTLPRSTVTGCSVWISTRRRLSATQWV